MKEAMRLLLAAAVSAGTVFLIRDVREVPAARAAAPATAATVPPELFARVAEIERLLAEATTAPEPQTPPEPPRIDDARLDRLERTVAALAARPAAPAREEDQRFRNLGNSQLRAHAAELSGRDAVDAWYTLLGRDLPPEERASALDAVADLHLKLKDYASAAAAWEEALETEGVRGTQRAHGYMHRRGWALLYGGNQEAALEQMDRLLAEPGLTENMESVARLQSGHWSYVAGDKDRARREYQAVIDRWGRSPEAALRQRADSAVRTMADLGLR